MNHLACMHACMHACMLGFSKKILRDVFLLYILFNGDAAAHLLRSWCSLPTPLPSWYSAPLKRKNISTMSTQDPLTIYWNAWLVSEMGVGAPLGDLLLESPHALSKLRTNQNIFFSGNNLAVLLNVVYLKIMSIFCYLLTKQCYFHLVIELFLILHNQFNSPHHQLDCEICFSNN